MAETLLWLKFRCNTTSKKLQDEYFLPYWKIYSKTVHRRTQTLHLRSKYFFIKQYTDYRYVIVNVKGPRLSMLGFLHFCAWGITGDQKIKKL